MVISTTTNPCNFLYGGLSPHFTGGEGKGELHD